MFLSGRHFIRFAACSERVLCARSLWMLIYARRVPSRLLIKWKLKNGSTEWAENRTSLYFKVCNSVFVHNDDTDWYSMFRSLSNIRLAFCMLSHLNVHITLVLNTRTHQYKLLSVTRFSQQTNLSISTTWFLFNLVTTHVLHLRSLLLVHLSSPSWKSLIALFSMLHLVYGMNSPLIFVSLVRHSLLHFHLSHMAVHHLHHLYHHLHLLLLVQSFIVNLRLGSSAKPFLHRRFSCWTDSTDSWTI